VVIPVLVIEGTDTVGWPSVVSAIETGAGKVGGSASVTVLVTVKKTLWILPGISEQLIEVAVLYVVAVGDGL
jgi:hypothetical protein